MNVRRLTRWGSGVRYSHFTGRKVIVRYIYSGEDVKRLAKTISSNSIFEAEKVITVKHNGGSLKIAVFLMGTTLPYTGKYGKALSMTIEHKDINNGKEYIYLHRNYNKVEMSETWRNKQQLAYWKGRGHLDVMDAVVKALVIETV